MAREKNELLKKSYYDPFSAAGFAGAAKLAKVTGVQRNVVNKWIQNQDAYTLHKQYRKRFQRRKTIVSGILEQFQCDLIDIQKLKKENDGYGYIFMCIDVFSKMAHAIPLKTKTGQSIITALKKTFKVLGTPKRLQTDKGTEFLNQPLQRYLKKIGIKHFTSQNETIKCAIVERLNRTILTRLARYFTHSGKKRYVDVLSGIIESYNKSYHRSIKRRPVDVNTHNSHEVRNALYGIPVKRSTKSKFQPGDRVRISLARGNFQKGYSQSWSEELFTISRELQTAPRTYIIKSDDGEEIIGSFYKFELQKVGDEVEFKIDAILKERKVGRGRKEILVKWSGYPDSFNSWIPKTNLTNYNQ